MLLRGVHRHFFCQNTLFRFQRTGRFRFCAQIHQQFNFRRAPPGQLFFHRIPDRIPAPEQYHSGIVLGDHHCRRVGAAHKVDVHHIPAEGIAQPNGNRRCQHDAGHSHPQTQTPAEGQPAQQDEHQTDNGRIGRIKVEPRTRFCRYPDGPAVEQTGQGCRQYGEHTMQRRKGGHKPGERRAEA